MTEKFDHIIYGVAYYHEYMRYERLDKYIEMMKDAGISVVRQTRYSSQIGIAPL